MRIHPLVLEEDTLTGLSFPLSFAELDYSARRILNSIFSRPRSSLVVRELGPIFLRLDDWLTVGGG